LINDGSTWDVAGVAIVPKTALSNSTGPGIIQRRCGGAIGGTVATEGGVGFVLMGDKFDTEDKDPVRLRPVVSRVNIFNLRRVASRFPFGD
jgi:hypothetical protein